MDAAALAQAMGCTLDRARGAVDGMNTAMLAADCTTVRRAAMWSAQIGHETLSLRYDQEIWGPTTQQKKYDPASGSQLSRNLGNTARGDGFRYRGRGRIQLTGKVNYGAFSRWCHGRGLAPTADHFVRNPDLVAQPPWRELAAAWYWTVARRLNPPADRADVRECTRLINGGYNGIGDRQARYDRALRLGSALLPSGGAPAVTPAAPPPPPPPRRSRTEDQDMPPIRTAQPAVGQQKWDWPTERAILAFEPTGTAAGKVLVKLDHGGRGGWVHLIRWWIRDPNWSPNVPRHFNQDHRLGASHGHAGSERFVGYGWVVYPPAGADFVEVVTSAPDGAQLQAVYH